MKQPVEEDQESGERIDIKDDPTYPVLLFPQVFYTSRLNAGHQHVLEHMLDSLHLIVIVFIMIGMLMMMLREK